MSGRSVVIPAGLHAFPDRGPAWAQWLRALPELVRDVMAEWRLVADGQMSGDPHYEVPALLWNRWDDVIASGDVRRTVRRRLRVIVDTAGLDEQRARDWTVVRMLHNAMWCVEDSPLGLDAESRDYLAMCLVLADAMAV